MLLYLIAAKIKIMAKTKKRPKRLTKSANSRYKSTIKRRRPIHKKNSSPSDNGNCLSSFRRMAGFVIA